MGTKKNEASGAAKRAGAKPAARRAARSAWKGAISFGLVNIPVGLYAATRSSGIDFDWLDRRTLDPVGYKRVNKATGEEVGPEDIVRGVEYEHDRYVVLTDEEIESAYPRSTQTIEIEAFIDADEIPFVYLERPYYIAPLEHGEKVYALLREALRKSNRVAVARVVIHTRQHLAVLMPCGRAIVLNLMRWGGEVRSSAELNLPPAGEKPAGLRDTEMKMALQLIGDMTQKWDADQFRNSFSDEIHQLVEAKAHAGQLQTVQEAPQPEEPEASNVVDLTQLLRRSLQGKQRSGADGPPASTSARKRGADQAAATRKSKGKADSSPALPAKRRAPAAAKAAPAGAGRKAA